VSASLAHAIGRLRTDAIPAHGLCPYTGHTSIDPAITGELAEERNAERAQPERRTK